MMIAINAAKGQQPQKYLFQNGAVNATEEARRTAAVTTPQQRPRATPESPYDIPTPPGALPLFSVGEGATAVGDNAARQRGSEGGRRGVSLVKH